MSRISKHVAVQALLSDALSFCYLDSSQKPLLEWPVWLVCCSGKRTALVEFFRELTSPQPATMVWNQVGDGRKAGEVDRERSVICFLLVSWTLDFYLELCMREQWADENLQVLKGDGILRICFCIGGVLGQWRVGPGLRSIHFPSTNFGVRCIPSRYFGCDRSWWWKSWSQSHPNGEANGAIATTRRNVSWLQSKVLIISGSKMLHDDTFIFTFLDSVQPSSKASRWKFEKSCQVSNCGAE